MFGSVAKVKIMKLFLFHMEKVFDIEEIRRRAQVTVKSARKEINLLKRIGFLKQRVVYKERSGRASGKKRVPGWTVNPDFPYLAPLQAMLVYKNSLRHKDVIRKLNGIGNLKLVIISGIFIQNWESRVDIMIVGDNIKNNSLYNVIKGMEAEIGRAVRYSVLSTDEFQYRMTMCDKLVRDVLDYPHEKIVNKIEIE